LSRGPPVRAASAGLPRSWCAQCSVGRRVADTSCTTITTITTGSPRTHRRAADCHHRRQRAQSRPVWPPSSGATTPPRPPSTGGSPPPTSTTSLARVDGHDKRRSQRPPDPHELPAPTT